jgi:hypothetical protein
VVDVRSDHLRPRRLIPDGQATGKIALLYSTAGWIPRSMLRRRTPPWWNGSLP